MLPQRKTTTTRKNRAPHLVDGQYYSNATNLCKFSSCVCVLVSSFNLIILWQRNIMVGRLLPAKKRFSVLGHRGLLICRRFNIWGLGNCNLGIIAQIMSDLFFWLVRVLPFYAPPPIHKNVSRYLLRELEGESVVLTANCSKGEQKHSLLPPHRD